MKAYVLHDIGDLQLEIVEDPILKENEVLVEVKATGICGSDIARIYKTGTYSFPLIPGHEFSGVVVKHGMGVNPNWKGKCVGVFPLIHCKTCIPCQKKQYEMCRNYSYLGSRRDGGFAQYVAVPEGNLIELPENVSFEEAAMLEPMAVAVHAIRRAMPNVTDVIAICGLGTIGLLLLMFLRESGIHNTLVIGNKEYQRQIVLKMGLSEDFYCDSCKQDVNRWIMDRTDGMGSQVFFECVGKNQTLMQAINSTAPAGKIILVGNPYSDMNVEKTIYWKILRNQLTVIGTWNSSFTHEQDDDWHYVLKRLEQKRITPTSLISHTFPFEELEKGFHIMRAKTDDYGKIMGKIK